MGSLPVEPREGSQSFAGPHQLLYAQPTVGQAGAVHLTAKGTSPQVPQKPMSPIPLCNPETAPRASSARFSILSREGSNAWERQMAGTASPS
jgi:hypothetical protein